MLVAVAALLGSCFLIGLSIALCKMFQLYNMIYQNEIPIPETLVSNKAISGACFAGNAKILSCVRYEK